MRDVCNSDNIIDSRDAIRQLRDILDTLRCEYDDYIESIADERIGDKELDDDAKEAILEAVKSEHSFEEWLEEEEPSDKEDYIDLLKLCEEGEQSITDWIYGETLIHDDYFEKYAEELAEDIGAIDRNARWPLNHIDWEAAAEELKQDYIELDYGGETYWARS